MADFSNDITVDLTDLDDIARRLGRLAGKAPAVITKALREATKSSRKRIIARAATILNLKMSSIKSRVKITKTPTRSSPSSRVRIKESGFPNLISFKGTRQVKAGVRAKPRKDGPTELHKSAFIQFSTNRGEEGGERGQKIVMQRKRFGSHREPKRPMQAVVGPTLIGRVLLRQDWISKERERYGGDIADQVTAGIDKELSGGKR